MLVAVLCVVACSLTGWGEENLTATDVISRHLDSIGPAAARSAIKSRVIRGRVQTQIVGGTLRAEGSGMIVSVGTKLSIALQVNHRQLNNEQFVFDGSKAQIALIGPAKRSILGQFLYQQDQILRDGLVGGTMLTAWPLHDPKLRQAVVKYEGLKKIDGRDVHEVRYEPKKADRELHIHLYFEPDTYRHVKTTYDFAVPPSFGHNQLEHGSYTRIRVDETFSDFRQVDGLTLPYSWNLRCTTIGTTSTITEWQMNVDTVAHNNVVD